MGKVEVGVGVGVEVGVEVGVWTEAGVEAGVRVKVVMDADGVVVDPHSMTVRDTFLAVGRDLGQAPLHLFAHAVAVFHLIVWIPLNRLLF